MVAKTVLCTKHPRLMRLNSCVLSLQAYQNSLRQQFAKTAPTPEVLETVHTAVKSLLPNVVLPDPAAFGVVSFAEHHASISHPETTNVVADLFRFHNFTGVSVTFTCGTTPLDNELFPRGVYIGHTPVALVSNRDRRRCPITVEPFDFGDAQKRLNLAANQQGSVQKNMIIAWFGQLENSLTQCGSFWEQISVINSSLAQNMFAVGDIKTLQVPMELVCAKLLVQRLECLADDWLTQALVNEKLRGQLVGVLDGTFGFFDQKNRRGTVLFWENTSKVLRPVHIGVDGFSVQVPSDPVLLAKKLRTGVLVPAPGLAMLLLSFVLGVNNFGGLLQYDYLAQARRKLVESVTSPLDQSAREQLASRCDSGYVNFEFRPTTKGGLLRLGDPITKKVLQQDAVLSMQNHTADCVAWLGGRF